MITDESNQDQPLYKVIFPKYRGGESVLKPRKTAPTFSMYHTRIYSYTIDIHDKSINSSNNKPKLIDIDEHGCMLSTCAIIKIILYE